MKSIAIVGAGPTGIYTLFSLLRTGEPLSVDIYEQEAQAGVGMPYSMQTNHRLMLANIASIEIPPLLCSYLAWLRRQPAEYLTQYGVAKTGLHERQFLPRILLGQYFADQLDALVQHAGERGVEVAVHVSSKVSDMEAQPDGVALWVNGQMLSTKYDLAVIASGHVWPQDRGSRPLYFPSPWSGLLDASIPACRVGIMGTSLSAIDAAMAVAAQHGAFVAEAFGSRASSSGESPHADNDEGVAALAQLAPMLGGRQAFVLDEGSQSLQITLMSRAGILPEADFYCPIPYEPLVFAGEAAMQQEIAQGPSGLLDRAFGLMAHELRAVDPEWSQRVALDTLNADTFSQAYFTDRRRHDPFHWAQHNLDEVLRNREDRHTVPWRYAILRLHEVMQDIVPHLSDDDTQRFKSGLGKVFMDNYAAVPPESIRRLLALNQAGVLSLKALGEDYELLVDGPETQVRTDGDSLAFDVFIDARGQRPLKTADLPFPRLRRQLMACDDDTPVVGDDYTLQEPQEVQGRIAFGALPYLMHDQPFIQGITACAEIGRAVARSLTQKAVRTRTRVASDWW